jgi:hypothetical protein
MAKLADLIKEAKVPEAIPAPKLVDEEVEKLAEVLDALAEEDTLLDDLARAAVALEVLEKRYGQKVNA